jgi:hypothetical protein
MYSSHIWKTDSKINIYTKQAWSYTNSDVEYICGTTLWNSRKERKEKRMTEHQ